MILPCTGLLDTTDTLECGSEYAIYQKRFSGSLEESVEASLQMEIVLDRLSLVLGISKELLYTKLDTIGKKFQEFGFTIKY